MFNMFFRKNAYQLCGAVPFIVIRREQLADVCSRGPDKQRLELPVIRN